MKLSFSFEATDEHGQTQSGQLAAPDRQAAEAQLQARGWTVRSIETALATQPKGQSPLTEREVVGLLEQLRTLTQAGVPLPSGLRAASAELESAPIRAACADLARHLDQGRSLDAALLAEADRFPAHLRGLVHAGARSGRLADVLGEVVQASNLGHELRGRIWAALAYPAVVLVIVIILTGVICHLSSQIIDGIALDFASFNPQRPDTTSTTAALLALTQFIAAYDAYLVVGFVGVVLLGWLGARLLVKPAVRRRLLGSLPLVGPLSRFVALAEFCHLTALLVDAATPLPEAIDLAGSSVGDAALAEDCRATAAAVAAGEPFSQALQVWSGLPAGLGQLLAWGEAQQSVGEALRFAGDMFEARAESQATFTRQVLSGSLLLLIVWFLGFAIATIYLPITLAIRSLSVLAG